MPLGMAMNGTNTCTEFCGHTEIPHMRALAREHWREFLLYGRDLRSSVKAELLTTEHQPPLTAKDYREQLVQTLTSLKQLAETTIRKAQTRYKGQFDRKAQQPHYTVGNWVMVNFPQEVTRENEETLAPLARTPLSC